MYVACMGGSHTHKMTACDVNPYALQPEKNQEIISNFVGLGLSLDQVPIYLRHPIVLVCVGMR